MQLVMLEKHNQRAGALAMVIARLGPLLLAQRPSSHPVALLQVYACAGNSGAPLGTWLAHGDAVSAMDVLHSVPAAAAAGNGDGGVALLTASWDGTVRLWECAPCLGRLLALPYRAQALLLHLLQDAAVPVIHCQLFIAITSPFLQLGGGASAMGQHARRCASGPAQPAGWQRRRRHLVCCRQRQRGPGGNGR